MVISTKLGYGVDGVEDWTGPCITAGVEQALRDTKHRLHRHRPPALLPSTTLARGDVIDALERAKRDGKIRAIAYSGENDDLAFAIAMQRFDGFMASLNICDQRVIDATLPALHGKGFIAKRPSANHPWRFDQAPVGDYCETYWHRWKAMGLSNHGLDWGELAIRFALSIPGVASAIVGTGSLIHLLQNLNGRLRANWSRRSWPSCARLFASTTAAGRGRSSRPARRSTAQQHRPKLCRHGEVRLPAFDRTSRGQVHPRTPCAVRLLRKLHVHRDRR